ncbi:MAG: hypothetical protein M1831_005186 [Alyxoria varia]|nr:MAG: hypothetical protein M1831_005186 [Alyxoria varia]
MARRRDLPLWLSFTLLTLSTFFSCLAHAAADEQKPLADTELRYKYGDPIPVTCVNRSIETGEHIADAQGRLQYIPFPTCNETEVNCTLDFIDDPLFHQLEFYVHNDAPLTCRIPTRPMSVSKYIDPENQVGALGSESAAYTPLIVALSGVLQLSHLHVANNLNVLVHAAPKSVAPGVIDAATAYSVSAGSRNVRVVIGDALPLRFSVRWYPSSSLPSGWQGVGGHVTGTMVLYCLISAGASAAICVTYFRGIELPRRLRSHGRDRVGLLGMDGSSVRARLGGYGYSGGGGGSNSTSNGIGGGWGYVGPGKMD